MPPYLQNINRKLEIDMHSALSLIIFVVISKQY